MPVSKRRKAIRFFTLEGMLHAIENDHPYQYRHLVLKYASQKAAPFTRKEVCEACGIPINAISRIVDALLGELALLDHGRKECEVTAHDSKALIYNPESKGPY